VGEQTRGWANGKMLVFDTSFIHETFNEGNQARRSAAQRSARPGATCRAAASATLCGRAHTDDAPVLVAPRRTATCC
jgi:hypothetical protein